MLYFRSSALTHLTTKILHPLTKWGHFLNLRCTENYHFTLYFLSSTLFCQDSSCDWCHTVFLFPCLAYFTLYNALQLTTFLQITDFLNFYGRFLPILWKKGNLLFSVCQLFEHFTWSFTWRELHSICQVRFELVLKLILPVGLERLSLPCVWPGVCGFSSVCLLQAVWCKMNQNGTCLSADASEILSSALSDAVESFECHWFVVMLNFTLLRLGKN